jgi:hypothetical protein
MADPLVVVADLLAPAFAEELAKTVAAKLKESGALAGYRVNVKAKSGTIWLEGTVSDEKQLAAALGVAEATPGVERVVNRLVVELQQAPAAAAPLGMPAAAWNMAGVPEPVQPAEPALEAAPEKKPTRNPFTAMAETLFFKQPVDEQPAADQVQLVQATATAGRVRTPAGRGPAARRTASSTTSPGSRSGSSSPASSRVTAFQACGDPSRLVRPSRARASRTSPNAASAPSRSARSTRAAANSDSATWLRAASRPRSRAAQALRARASPAAPAVAT